MDISYLTGACDKWASIAERDSSPPSNHREHTLDSNIGHRADRFASLKTTPSPTKLDQKKDQPAQMENHNQQGPSGRQLTLPIRGNPANEQAPGGQLANITTNDFTIARHTIDTNFQNLATKSQKLDMRVAATAPKLAEVDKTIEDINQDYAFAYSARIETDVEVSCVKQRCATLEEAEKACVADRRLTKRQLSAVYEHLDNGMSYLQMQLRPMPIGLSLPTVTLLIQSLKARAMASCLLGTTRKKVAEESCTVHQRTRSCLGVCQGRSYLSGGH
jgi:hypothetical protein